MPTFISRTRSYLRTLFVPNGRHRAKSLPRAAHRARPACSASVTPPLRAALRVRPYLLAHGTGAVR